LKGPAPRAPHEKYELGNDCFLSFLIEPMNLLIRVFLVWLSSFVRKPLGILQESQLLGIVLPNDLDIYFHMNNGRYLTFMDLGRLDLILRTGMRKPAKKYGWNPIVAASWIRYRKPLYCFQKFDLKTKVVGWSDRWFVMEQKIMCKGKMHTQAYIKGVFFGPKGVVRTQEVLHALGHDEPSPELPDFIKNWVSARPAYNE